MSDIEGKAARWQRRSVGNDGVSIEERDFRDRRQSCEVAATECGQRRSFKIVCCNFYNRLFLIAAWRWVDRKEEARQNHQNPEAPLGFACLYKTQS